VSEPTLRVSVIVPALNEERRLPGLLEALRWMPVHEVIVADGGSTDRTAAIAAATGAKVISAPRGRGSQQAAGARLATGTVLWFLHADAVPPPDAIARIREALREPEVVGGAFYLRTVSEGDRGGRGSWLRIADLRSRLTGYPYGDQGIFVRRSAYEAAGGMPEQPLLEDLALVRALRRVGALRTVPVEVTVSGRRFEARPLYYLLVMNLFPTLYRLGVSPDTLARWYHNER
jgi:rSAM/selenodomain-associated transferase 2